MSKIFLKENEKYRAISAVKDTVTLELLKEDGSGDSSKRLNIHAGELEMISRKTLEMEVRANTPEDLGTKDPVTEDKK